VVHAPRTYVLETRLRALSQNLHLLIAFARASLVVVNVGFVRAGHKYLLRQQLPVDYDFAVGHIEDPRTRSHPVVPNYRSDPPQNYTGSVFSCMNNYITLCVIAWQQRYVMSRREKALPSE
jgi:hypothetical protein